ncbi:MAG TPA: hypothetical protein PLO62_05080 [Candidatus Hydrogenedentes bacterium]|nr:hypothetical protein [Candidatus Hydrogenedentota bacterium]HOS04210.1 hypothetical protein [Candidatus Hydrogenedentota bacterium]
MKHVRKISALPSVAEDNKPFDITFITDIMRAFITKKSAQT